MKYVRLSYGRCADFAVVPGHQKYRQGRKNTLKHFFIFIADFLMIKKVYSLLVNAAFRGSNKYYYFLVLNINIYKQKFIHKGTLEF